MLMLKWSVRARRKASDLISVDTTRYKLFQLNALFPRDALSNAVLRIHRTLYVERRFRLRDGEQISIDVIG